MSDQANLDTVKRLYAAFGAGDLPNLLGVLDVNIDWVTRGTAPWSGEGRGHEHVQHFFEKFGSSASLETFEPRTFVVDGDTVVMLSYEEGSSRQTGRDWKAHFTHVFTLAGAKITAHREYIDTHALASSASLASAIETWSVIGRRTLRR